MSTRRAARKDANHGTIVDTFRGLGASVEVLEPRDRGSKSGGVPDLLIGYRNVNELVEVKVPGGKLNPRQEQWHRTWKGRRPFVVERASECIEILQAIREEGGP